jgi:hypothetical protein
MENQEVKTKKVAVVGNKQTELIIGAGALKLESAIKNLSEVVKMVENFDQIISDKTLKVETLDNITELETKFKQEKATKEFNLKLDFEAAKDKYTNDYLASKSMKSILIADYDTLNHKAARNDEDIKKEINAAVHSATGAMTKEHNNTLQIKELEYKNKEADNIAQLKQQGETITLLKSQITELIKQLDAERQAGIERSKSTSVGTINVQK